LYKVRTLWEGIFYQSTTIDYSKENNSNLENMPFKKINTERCAVGFANENTPSHANSAKKYKSENLVTPTQEADDEAR
jgi:hypothetical protein